MYDTREEAYAQVHQYSGADHKVFKHKMEAKVAFMKFKNSFNWREPHCRGGVKYDLLKYQLDIAIKQRNHAIKTAKLNARMLNAVASQVLLDDELNKMTHLNLGEWSWKLCWSLIFVCGYLYNCYVKSGCVYVNIFCDWN